MGYSTQDVASAVGVSYRVLDHWIHRGYVPAQSNGTGVPRSISRGSAIRAAQVAALVRAGLTPRAASRVITSGAPPGPVVITLDTAAVEAGLRGKLDDGLPESDAG